MKNNIIYSIALLLLFVSCQQDIVTYNDGYDDGKTPTGVPTIERISLVSDTSVAVDEVSLAAMIYIRGTNLSQVSSIKFNDVETDLKTVYARNSHIVLPVPRILPQIVDNKLTITTNKGVVSETLVVTIPKLVVEGFENEFASFGDTLRIVGQNFDLYDITTTDGRVTMNGRTLDILEADQDYISIVMPQGVADGVSVELSGGKIDSPITLKFREVGIPVLTFEGTWGDGWSPTDGSGEGDPKPLLGTTQFIRTNADFEAWSWNTLYGGGYNMLDSNVKDNPQDYIFKFEIYTTKAISFKTIHFEANGAEQRYPWNPAVGGIPFDTNRQWKTVRIELTELGWVLPEGWNGFSMVYSPEKDTSVDFSIANARIVKK